MIYRRYLCFVLLVIFSSTGYSYCNQDAPYLNQCARKTCCQLMGGISYCDASAKRYVCNNGDYSTCYCNRHAVMDLQLLQGCCLWQGGVLNIDQGMVVCNNGSVSETCSGELPVTNFSIW